jgi:hypothetical protein
MSKNHSTPSPVRSKPAKPYPDFPLFPHATRRWAKKIRGQLHYFGPWEDPDAALAKYLEQKNDLHAGRTPRADPEALTVKDLVNHFLNAKLARVNTGELSPRSWADYKTRPTPSWRRSARVGWWMTSTRTTSPGCAPSWPSATVRCGSATPSSAFAPCSSTPSTPG